jgi:hypothetical protein
LTVEDVKVVLEQYWSWVRDRTTLREVSDWVEITTPYLDRHNDHLQIYAKRRDGDFLLTDDGYIVDDLEVSGCKIDSVKRQALLKMTLNGFGVHLNGRALEVHASSENFAPRKHNLVQAMLAVNDLFYLASPVISSLFFEDVVTWLDEADIRYTPQVKFTGTSGFDHVFDFVIPKSRRKPERIMRAINRPGRDTAETMAFGWLDTKEVRPSESKAYAILNDTEQRVSPAVLDALRSYDVRPVLWSEREAVREELAA